MKKTYTVIVFAFIALILFAFSTEYMQKQETTKPGSDDPTKDPNFAFNKKNFVLAFNQYKDRLAQGIAGNIPVDPSGTFMVDKNGNLTAKHEETLWDQPNPLPPQGDVVSGYTWSQPVSSYAPIVGTLVYSGAIDDAFTSAISMGGMTFTFDGIAYTTFGISSNGFILLGSTIGSTVDYNNIANASDANGISAMSRDLLCKATGRIEYLLSGVVGSRVLTIQYSNWAFYNLGNPDGTLNFQIKLFETSNNIQVVYGTNTFQALTNTPQVGLKGATNADFNARTTASNWSATTAATLNTNVCSWAAGVVPAANLTFQWVPPVASPMTYVSSNTLQLQNGVPVFGIPSGLVNNQVVQIQVVTSGTLSPFSVTGFSLGTNGSTNPPTDITNAKIYYTGTSNVFSTATLFGTTVGPNGTFALAGSQVLSSGTNYFWLTYDVPGTATYLNTLDGQCNNITGTGAMGTVVPTTIAPVGNRFIDKYCVGTFTNAGSCCGPIYYKCKHSRYK